ncbi:PhzF family phenazine biosynthesis protein [Tautonia plasticadhaerens]|uniref:Putative isomerase YddE n=1 Tax=Tautonia plasticadhaerens TaxID=2527974 RepID=A0A518HBC9_9BACT|nr:PhzF family phenazine biosynthesis protein [Tautonia plasticadhaerens]QDV38164.1 putative isomerase YddE [Tautonia plasticadhaerens]
MGQRIVQVDAFADRPFSGNPAAVCVLRSPADEGWMRAVAREMNLSETAFLHPEPRPDEPDSYRLRWFTPTVEVDLCGHATLAAAHVLWEDGHRPEGEPITFSTRSGRLRARRPGGLIALDFPSEPVAEREPPRGLVEAIGLVPRFVGGNRMDVLVQVDTEEEVLGLSPDFGRLRAIPTRGVIVTARSDRPGVDFVSRFFAPAAGVDEDPVTGSAHCALAPFWSERLGLGTMTGEQVSARRGTVRVRVLGDRVELAGSAVTVLRGELA